MTLAYSEPFQTSKIEHFVKIVTNLKSSIVLAKCSIIGISQNSECAYA